MLLPGADETAVDHSLQRICADMGTCGLQGAPFPVRLSLGAATARTPEELESVLRKAEQRMYENKTAYKTAQS